MAKIYRARIESYDEETGEIKVIRDENEYYEGFVFYGKGEKNEEGANPVRGILMNVNAIDIAGMIHNEEAFKRAYEVLRVVEKTERLLKSFGEEDGACLQ